MQKEVGTKMYILDRLFGPNCPLTRAFTLQLIPFIDANFATFECQVNTPQAYTTFAYDLSRVEAEYYNGCIRASTTASCKAGLGSEGAATDVSFQLLVDELKWGRYHGQALPASLQVLLLPSPPLRQPAPPAQPAPAPSGPQVPLSPLPPHGERRPGRKGTPVQNPRPIQRLHLRVGENTRGVLRGVVLPAINGCVLCKRWHLGMTCFEGFPRAASHAHPQTAVVDIVASALSAERAASSSAE